MFISEMLGDGPSLTVLFVGFIGLGLIGFCLSRFRWWASIPVVLILVFWAIMLFADFYDPSLYPVYAKDPVFLYSATASIVVGTILPIVGIGLNFCELLYKRDKQRRSDLSSATIAKSSR